MTPGPAYPHPIGSRVAFVDCNGGNRREGVVTDLPGPWTIRVKVGAAVYLLAVSLVVDRGGVEAPAPAPEPVKGGQLDLF